VNSKSPDFVCPYCSTGFADFETLRNHLVATHSGEALPEPPGTVAFSINGQPYKMQVQPEWTLYYVIHDLIGLTGSKLMCDRGACGSCTVIMNGRGILSCMTLAIECDDAQIQTVEGVAGENHPIIEEYVANHCMQCGYCTPGFVVTSKNLLDKNTDPTEEEVREELAGNLCRCGTYPQHPKAVLAAAAKLRASAEG
jgi:aerobic-type carbon monoxide dehydrogenase small subunit (CoxS/CutS family)